jgi:hypothetical protein
MHLHIVKTDDQGVCVACKDLVSNDLRSWTTTIEILRNKYVTLTYIVVCVIDDPKTFAKLLYIRV